MDQIILKIRQKLTAYSDPGIKKSSESFFKEGVKIYGLRNAAVHSMSRELFRELPDRTKENVFTLCEELWRSGYLEESLIACNWAYSVRKSFELGDIVVFERWIDNYVTNWASCDTFCNHTVGELAVKYPSTIAYLKKWAHSDNRWMRRAAAVSLIIPARKGKFPDDIFEIATIMLTDKDDMVQKGYGWMLKAASEAYQKDVYDFVMKHRSSMPRTSFRYAIEKMTPELRAKAMSK
jgi:3-methyladenine DNA glycosylase AlkD